MPFKVEVPKPQKPTIKLPGWLGVVLESGTKTGLIGKGFKLLKKTLKNSDQNDPNEINKTEEDIENFISKVLKEMKKNE
jgi:hypothetical protein